MSGTYPDPNNPDRTLARSEVQRREAYFEKADSEYGRLHPSLLDLVKQCLHNAPGRRPSSNELLAKLEKMNEKVESESESGGVALRQLEISKVMLTKELGDKRRRVQELEVRENFKLTILRWINYGCIIVYDNSRTSDGSIQMIFKKRKLTLYSTYLPHSC